MANDIPPCSTCVSPSIVGVTQHLLPARREELGENMRGLSLPGDEQVEVTDWPTPEVGPREVKVRVEASAICRSDMSLYYGDPLVGDTDPGEVIPGHEPAGVVEDVGEAVNQLHPGDRVAISCFVGCERCEFCRQGEPYRCDDVEFVGFDIHGGDAESIVVPEFVCHEMPDEMSMVTGAIATDAIGNLFNTMKQLEVDATDTVGVVGLGPMGLSGVLNADALGADVVAFDFVEHRRDTAADLGADHTVAPSREDLEVHVAEVAGDVNKWVDTSGSDAGINMALDLVSRHGTVAQVGANHEATIAPTDQLVHKGVDYVGSWYFQLWQWPEIASFIVDEIGNDRAEKLISDRFPIEEDAATEAFRRFDNRETLKVVFTP